VTNLEQPFEILRTGHRRQGEIGEDVERINNMGETLKNVPVSIHFI
jgi:hypothetical protein